MCAGSSFTGVLLCVHYLCYLPVKNAAAAAGFSLACEDFERMFDNSFPACAIFVVVVVVVVVVCLFQVEISSRTLIPLFRPGSGHSGSAS